MSGGPSARAGSMRSLKAGKPGMPRPDAWWMWQQAFPGRLDQIRHVRSAVRQMLDGCPVIDDVVLLLSELSANAVMHSRSSEPGRTFTVRVSHIPGDCTWAQVEDQGSVWDGDLHVSARDQSGLFLLLTLTSSCGVAETPAGHCVVWFRLQCRPPAGTGRAADDC